MTKQGGVVLLFARNRVIHTPRYPQTARTHGSGKTDPSGLEILLPLRCSHVGLCVVVARARGRDGPTGHVQLDDVRLTGFQRFAHLIVAQPLRG